MGSAIRPTNSGIITAGRDGVVVGCVAALTIDRRFDTSSIQVIHDKLNILVPVAPTIDNVHCHSEFFPTGIAIEAIAPLGVAGLLQVTAGLAGAVLERHAGILRRDPVSKGGHNDTSWSGNPGVFSHALRQLTTIN